MILTKKEIEKEIARKRVRIEPFDSSALGPASIDLTLDKRVRVFQPGKKAVHIDEKTDYKKITRIVDIANGYILEPGELVLGITKEKITLPGNICGWLNSRSRFARVGLMSHVTAPFICPGISNHQVIEVYNAGPKRLKLFPGVKVCHLVLEECRGSSVYNGIFKNQRL